MALTAIGLHSFSVQKLAQEQASYEERLEHLSLAIEAQFMIAMYGVRGAIALDASLARISAQQFSDYVNALDLAADFKGVRAFSVLERTSTDWQTGQLSGQVCRAPQCPGRSTRTRLGCRPDRT